MFRYIGNKTKLLPMIINEISANTKPKSTVVDLMAGTGSVSVALRTNGFHVISSDMMTYSKHHLVTQLLINKAPDFLELNKHIAINNIGYEAVLVYLNSLAPKEGYFFQEFSPEGTPANGTRKKNRCYT